MAKGNDDGACRADQLASELAVCRQRGVERLDRRSHNQTPVSLPILEQLARSYATASGTLANGRIGQIKHLLRAALRAYDDAIEAQLITDLFFGDAGKVVLRSAGQLLDFARARSGTDNDEQFRELRRLAFRHFAAFLLRFAADGQPAADGHGRADAVIRLGSGPGLVPGWPDGTNPEPAAPPASAEQQRIESALESATRITVYGVAPRSLVQAMQRIAQQASQASSPLPWQQVSYVTPASDLIMATLGNARLGPPMQKWQFALKGIRDCVQQVQRACAAAGNADPEFTLLGVDELFFDVMIITTDASTGEESLWTSVGPASPRDEPLYLSFRPGTEEFALLKARAGQLSAKGTRIISRELEICPDGLAAVRRLDGTLHGGRLEVRALLAPGESPLPESEPSCLPVALTIVRSAEAGRPVLLLKNRARFASWNDFDKLSLISAGLFEEDLAHALGVPVFADRDARAALDGMWRAYGQPGPLPIPLEAFVRAAQRNIFTSCGLDLPPERYLHRGCHLLERDEDNRFLFFCVFEVTLYRHSGEDELQLARDWDPEQLVLVYQDALYQGDPQLLNRFLVNCRDWLTSEIFARPVALAAESAR